MERKGIALPDLLDEGNLSENGKEIQDFLCDGGTFQDIFGFSDDVMVAKYEIAYEHYRKEEYTHAIEGFSYLTNLSPYVHKYWQALAAAQIRIKAYGDAINSYLASALLDTNDPTPHLYSGHCCLELNQIPEAKEAFQQAMRVASRNHAHREIEEKARAWLSKLE